MDPARLKDVPLFADLSRRDRRLVAQHADEIEVTAGETLMEEGRLAYELFVIEEGTADVRRGGVKVAEVGPGEVVGEIGVLNRGVRSATVVASSPMKLIVMFRAEVGALSAGLSDVIAELEAIAERRSEAAE
jgi:CRP-like cAMP-binding protein